jgi:hypothetical protein
MSQLIGNESEDESPSTGGFFFASTTFLCVFSIAPPM